MMYVSWNILHIFVHFFLTNDDKDILSMHACIIKPPFVIQFK